MGTDGLARFNDLPAADARRALLECCAAPRWAEQMAAVRPYGSVEAAIRESDAIVTGLSVAELGEALAGHPRIGERPRLGDEGAAAADWSSREQSGVDAGDRETGRALTAANLEYEQRFGHIYLVCATDRTGTELLALLRGRLQNQPADEWQVVRTELQKINALRLQRILAGSP